MAPRALTRWLSGFYYGLKLFPFRKERRERLAHGRKKGFVGIQIDGPGILLLEIRLEPAEAVGADFLGQVEGGMEKERLVSLTGSPREVLRDNKAVTCILPDSRSVMVGQSRPPQHFTEVPGDLDALQQHYRFEVLGDDRMAGYLSRIVAITPRDAYRYGHRFWIERDSKMLLKSALTAVDGETIEQVMFTSINVLDSIPDSRFEPVTAGADFTWHRSEYDASADELPADPGWDVVDPPRGFSVSSNVKRRLGVDGDPVQHMVLSDGLASVSVF